MFGVCLGTKKQFPESGKISKMSTFPPHVLSAADKRTCPKLEFWDEHTNSDADLRDAPRHYEAGRASFSSAYCRRSTQGRKLRSNHLLHKTPLIHNLVGWIHCRTFHHFIYLLYKIIPRFHALSTYHESCQFGDLFAEIHLKISNNIH